MYIKAKFKEYIYPAKNGRCISGQVYYTTNYKIFCFANLDHRILRETAKTDPSVKAPFTFEEGGGIYLTKTVMQLFFYPK